MTDADTSAGIYRDHDRQGALAPWNVLMDIEEGLRTHLPDVDDYVVVTYHGRMRAAPGDYPWIVNDVLEVKWLTSGSDEDLDVVPAVRRLERIAHALLPHLPVAVATSGEIMGICEIAISRDRITACVFPETIGNSFQPETALSFVRGGSGWRVALAFDWVLRGPMTDLVGLDMGRELRDRLRRPGCWPARVRIEDGCVYADVDADMIADLNG